MAKALPKALTKAILKTLATNEDGPLTSAQLSERVNADPDLPPNQRKNAKQMAVLMKRMENEQEKVESAVLSRNGRSHHGTERFRVGYHAPELTLAEVDDASGVIAPPKKKQVTIQLPPDCVDYLKEQKRVRGLSAGRAVENLIRADIAVNGLPSDDDPQPEP